MAILKVIEVLANSDKGWEDATKNALRQASKTVKNIESIYIMEQTADVENNEIKWYGVNAKITFRID